MAQFELIMPKMGESIIEATILRWAKQVGDSIEVDETIAEIATDKVDSEVPSPIGGTIAKILFQENDTVPVGAVIALIDTVNGVVSAAPSQVDTLPLTANSNGKAALEAVTATLTPSILEPVAIEKGDGSRFYSPLVRNIAQQENISVQELEAIAGSGLQGRVTKRDVLAYVENRHEQPAAVPVQQKKPAPAPTPSFVSTSLDGNVEIVEMDRMRKLISEHMVMSKQTSPHVTSFVEADVTEMVKWREKVKGEYLKRYNEKITFTPIFVEAVARAIRDFPMINVSVDGNKILVKKDIHIGMAAALPSGNLIVPVIKNADQHNLAGLTKVVNDLANRARNNQLKPEDIQGGTFTLTNVGTFGNVMGTPIINQPQAAILATGAIRKKPAVIETEYGDLIAVRQMMFLSLSYDHRVVDGFLGGSFLRRIADYLEGFDVNRMV
jgi:2-oxoglutarate dehydrogenase E2 component (dihydrolipoamide succinyltransferase)